MSKQGSNTTAKSTRKKASARRPKVVSKKGLPLWAKDFLEDLRETGSIYHAASRAGVSRQAAYKARDTNAKFAHEWHAAMDIANGGLEKSMLQRARDGTDDIQLYEGIPCVDPKTKQPIMRRKHEQSLAIFMAKKRMPEVYGDHVGDGDTGENLDLPEMKTPAAVRKAEGLIVAAYNEGRISGVRYERLMRGVESRRKTIEVEELENRLVALETENGNEFL